MSYGHYGQPEPRRSEFLEQAAALLHKSAEANEKQYRDYPTALREGRERIAMKFAVLGAIELGQVTPEASVALVQAMGLAGSQG